MTANMTSYDRDAWVEIERWRDRRLTETSRRLVPKAVRDRLSSAGRTSRTTLEQLPGASGFEAVFVKSLGGLVDIGSRAAMSSVRSAAITSAYRKRGHPVAEVSDVKGLELRDIDKVKPNLALAYAGTAAAEGAAAGFLISGGEFLAAGGSVLGVGAGAAPGVGTVVGVMAADAAATLVAANRAVAHVAAYYGYDVDQPHERLFALAALSMGTAAESGKAAAYIEINKLVQMLARRATWDQLRQSVVTQVVEKVFTRLGFRITQRKLGQAVPVLGTVFGAGMNARLLSAVIDDVDHVYRERFLRDKYAIPLGDVALTNGDPAEEPEVIDIVEVVEGEIADGEASSHVSD